MSALLLLPLLFLSALAGKTFTTLSLIDNVGNNFLFRGGDTVVGGKFAYDELVAEMNQITTLPNPFQLVVLNLLNPNTTDKVSIGIEEAYWVANPTLGRTISTPFYGANLPPYNYSFDTMKSMALDLASWMDNLPALIPQARQLLVTPSDPPVVMYVHCSCGCDRTGEWSESYYMMYQNKSLTQARNINVEIIQREQVLGNLYAAEWFCEYLKYSLSYNLTCIFPDADAVQLPKCPITGTQWMSDTYVKGNTTYTTWQVNVTNSDLKNSVQTAISAYNSPTPIQFSGMVQDPVTATLYDLPPSMPAGIPPNQNFVWQYTIAGKSPMTLYITTPTVCVGAVSTVSAPPTQPPGIASSAAYLVPFLWMVVIAMLF